ncbi:MAG: PqqD family protein [Ignavibacteriae bacterium]|nr:PqqD family protein [Ignavibacteriota bacterium]
MKLSSKSSEASINLLALKPKRNLEWESREDDLVTLIIPKFKSQYLVKWFVPLLAKPNIKVKLDKFGSFVWRRCDGEATVARIGEEMAAEFGEPLEQLYERIGKFLAKLAKDKFVEMSE